MAAYSPVARGHTPPDIFLRTHQSHNVIGKVPGQVRSHKTRQASEGNTCVILVGTAEILEEKKFKRKRKDACEKEGVGRGGDNLARHSDVE